MILPVISWVFRVLFMQKNGKIRNTISFCALVCASAPVYANDLQPADLVNLSLEQLGNIEVTSVSKKSEKATEAAAAIFVITQEDIRRSGMTSIPEVLRLVPGLNVAQSGSHQWAISSRGFNDQFANKMLVLIDGRTVYTPLYSGVYWDVQDTPLQDVEQIEVIRGPGATQWGANAVNGVINIITKNAKDTQGTLVSQTVGNIDRSLTTMRHGAKISENAYARGYVKYDDRDEHRTASGTGAHDQWNKAQAGFRSDIKSDDGQKIMLQVDIYQAGENYNIRPASLTAVDAREQVKGGNILGKWDNKISSTSDVSVQMYYDSARRNNIIYDSNTQTFDVDLQHVWTAIPSHEVVWGGSYRLIESNILSTPYIGFTPQKSSDNLFSAFIQDKITLHEKDVFLTLGSKFEHNDYTGFEAQPSARLSWLVDSKQTLWTSVSRAVRTPDISTSSGTILVSPISSGPTVYLARSGADTKSEELVAYEAGYRIQPADNISIDTSVYYNDYSRLALGQLGAASGPFTSGALGGTYFIQSVIPVNTGTAHAWGGEISVKWNPYSYQEFTGGYALQQLKFDQQDVYGYSYNGKSPQQQFNISSTTLFPHGVEWTNALYYVDPLKALDLYSSQGTKAYYRLDMRLAWQAMTGMEISLVGQNLLYSSHKEFNGFLYQNSAEVPPSFYANVTWKF
jgi:iron complex outermembrane recepter protein